MRKSTHFISAGISGFLFCSPLPLFAQSGSVDDITDILKNGNTDTAMETLKAISDLKWNKAERHLSGATVDKKVYAVHHYIEVYYSPEVKNWINGEPPKLPGGLSDGAGIFAVAYDDKSKVLAVNGMLRGGSSTPSADGWSWGRREFNEADGTRKTGGFAFKQGASTCFACHGSTNDDGMVFLSKGTPPDPGTWTVPDSFKWPDSVPEPAAGRRINPLTTADPDFLNYFKLNDVDASKFRDFPPKIDDHIFAPKPEAVPGHDDESVLSFITSDQCMGCHNAAQLLSNTAPNMWYPDPDPAHDLVPGNKDAKTRRNFSPYGEWSASLNGLSGRDPVWHAQVESERNMRKKQDPKLEHFVTNVCFTCHGAMGTRQLEFDKLGKVDIADPSAYFTNADFYDTESKHAALARDGVSCAVCHQASAEGLGVDPGLTLWKPTPQSQPIKGAYTLPADFETYTAMFNPKNSNVVKDKDKAYWGPYPDEEMLSAPMDRALGQRARAGAHIRESKLCGSCHSVLVPALPVDYKLPAGIDSPFKDHVKMSFEQTTYFEWRNSFFENERVKGKTPLNTKHAMTCQNCHMQAHKPDTSRIVNAESDRFPPVQGRTEGINDFKKHRNVTRTTHERKSKKRQAGHLV